MAKILITGADGFLGSNVTRELLQRGHEVRAFVEKNKPSPTLAGLPVDLFPGDLLNPADVREAMKSCTMAIHAAANTNIWPSRSEIIRKINIDGTRHVIEAALEEGISRMVFVGTANSFGSGTLEQPGDETQPFTAGQYELDYIDSKYEAFQNILAAVRDRGLPCVTVCPTFMLGPYDTKPSSGKMVLAVYQRQVAGYTNGGRNYIYVKDAAIGVANALEKGRIGEAYILGNKNMSYKEAFGLMARLVHVRPPALPFPQPITLLYGALGEFFCKLTGKTPTVSYAMAKIACHQHYYTAAKAVREIDLPQTPIEVAIEESFNWMKGYGLVK